MFSVLLAKTMRLVVRKSVEDPIILNYNETLFLWMQRFIWLWIKIWKWALFFFIIGLPVSHYCAPGYSYGIACFWLIYAPICGIFFNTYHYADTNEGLYYLNLGCITPIQRKLKTPLDRF